jgi:hypothetical protein
MKNSRLLPTGKNYYHSVEWTSVFICFTCFSIVHIFQQLPIIKAQSSPTNRPVSTPMPYSRTPEPTGPIIQSFTFESPHPYSNYYSQSFPVIISGASSINVTFIAMTYTESNYDFLTIYRDSSLDKQLWRYSGSSGWPGTDGVAPISFPGPSFWVEFTSDGSVTCN